MLHKDNCVIVCANKNVHVHVCMLWAKDYKEKYLRCSKNRHKKNVVLLYHVFKIIILSELIF